MLRNQNDFHKKDLLSQTAKETGMMQNYTFKLVKFTKKMMKIVIKVPIIKKKKSQSTNQSYL